MPTITPARRFGDPGQPIGELGEAGLLQRLLATDPAPSSALLVANGDDAAVWRLQNGRDLVLSQDALVEGQDWETSWLTPYELGRRSLSVAISDLAAMGARPEYALATLCAPSSSLVEDAEEILAGLRSLGREIGCPIIGGDLSQTTGPLVLDLSVAGSVPSGKSLQRSKGAAGDLLVVTGTVGLAAAGLAALQGGVSSASAGTQEFWASCWRQPPLRLGEGQALLASGVACAGDLSDGLLVDSLRTATSSGCAAELWLDTLPLPRELRAAFGEAWLTTAIAGGEDFELLAAVTPSRWPELRDHWPSSLAPLTLVGRLLPGTGVVIRETEEGPVVPTPKAGSRHWGAP